MKTYLKLLLSVLLSALLTLSAYKLYYAHYVEFSLEARSLDKPGQVSILYHSPDNPDSWPTMPPSSGPSTVGNDFQKLKFKIPVKKLDTLNVLLGSGTQTMELRNVHFLHLKTFYTGKDTWSPDPPVEALSTHDGIITIKPLSAEQPRFRLTAPVAIIKGHGQIDWLFAGLIWFFGTLICFDGIRSLTARTSLALLDGKPTPIWQKYLTKAFFWSTLILLGSILYTITGYSWPGCDEYWSAACGLDHRLTFSEPWEAYVNAYMTWNQRLGNCIQFFVITAGKTYFDILNPFCLLLTIIAVIKLATGSIAISAKNTLLIVVTFALLLCAVPSPKQTLFLACPTCIYTWVAPFWLYFLSTLIRGERRFDLAQKKSSRIIIHSFLFLIGFCSGMTNECVIASLFLFLCIYIILKRKTIKSYQYAAIAGFIGGSIVFFAAPALRVRAAGAGSIPVNLSKIPYFDRLEYWPRLIGDLYTSTSLAWLVWIIVISIVMIGSFFLKDQRRILSHAMLMSVLLFMGAILMSSTYLAGAVPYSFGHLPASLLIIGACITILNAIYTRFPAGRSISCLAILLICPLATRKIVQAITFGRQTQSYLEHRTALMHNARQTDTIPVLEDLPFSNNDDTLIWIEDLKHPEVKQKAAQYYGVKEIKFTNDSH